MRIGEGGGNGGEIHQRLREKRAKKRSTQGANQGQGGSGLFQRLGTAGENQCVDRARRSKGERRGNTIAPNRRGRGGTNDVWGKGGEGREKKGNTQENEKFIRTLGEEAVDVENNMGSSAEMEEEEEGKRKGVTAAIKAVPAVDLKRREREREKGFFMLQLHQAGMKSQKKSSLVLDVVCLESDMTSRNIYVRGRDICIRDGNS